MSTIPTILPGLAKENGDDVVTPFQNRHVKVSASAGRNFGTPLANCSIGRVSVTTSRKGEQRSSSSSKKLVRARRLVQQYKTPSSKAKTTTAPMTNGSNIATTYIVTFLPGNIGMQLEPANPMTSLGCKVSSFADGGPAQPGQARMSNQIQVGDEILEINDDPIADQNYDAIVDRLKELKHGPRKILFRSGNSFGVAATSVEDDEQNTTTTSFNSHTKSTPGARSFSMNSQGSLTPIVSPPKGEHTNHYDQGSNKVLFMNPSAMSSPSSMAHSQNGANDKYMTTPQSLPSLSSTPSSPAYNLLNQDSVMTTDSTTFHANNTLFSADKARAKDVVLDIKDTSIDSASTITPSKIKNLSQEDLELGFGRSSHERQQQPFGGIFRPTHTHTQIHNTDDTTRNPSNSTTTAPRPPLTTVLKTVYSSFRVGKVGSFDFGSRLGEGIQGGGHSSWDDTFTRKSNVLHNLSQAAAMVTATRAKLADFSRDDDGDLDLEEEKKDEPVATLNNHEMHEDDDEKSAVETLSTPAQQTQAPTKPIGEVVACLQEAKKYAAERASNLEEQHLEFERRLREAREEANARVQQISQMQLATQADLEQKLMQANAKMEELTQQKSQVLADMERDLAAANEKVQEITQARDDALESLGSVTEELHDIGTKTDDQKANQYEVQLHVAKLQRELRDAKKENDKLATEVVTGKSQAEEMQGQLNAAEEALKEKQEELNGTKCMMESYEEKFIERENEMEAVLEDKEFQGRELSFAQSEIKKLKETLKKKENNTETAHEEIQSLQESLNMTQKELADQKQMSYDRESDLQMKFAACTTALTASNGKLEKLSLSFKEATDRGFSLEEALKQRDADLEALNNEIDSNVANLQGQLDRKEQTLEDTLAVLNRAEAEKDKLEKELQRQRDLSGKHEETQSALQATIIERHAQLARKDEELISLREKFNSLQHSNVTLAKEVQDIKETTNDMYQEKSRINKDLQATKIQLSDAKVQAATIQDTLLQRAKQFDSKAKDSQNELKKKESELASLTAKLERANAKIEALTTDVESKDSALQTSLASIRSLEDERDQLTRRESQLKSDIAEEQRENQSMQESLREARANLFEATNRVSFLERQLSAAEASRSISEKEMTALKEEVESLTTRIESQRETLDKTTSELSLTSSELVSLGTTSENLREELQQRMEEVQSVQKSLEVANTQYAKLHERFVQAAEESSGKIQGLTADLIKAQDDVADKLSAQSKMESQIAVLKQQIQDNESTMDDLRAKLTMEEEKLVELGNSNESIKKDSETKILEMSEELSKHAALAKQLEEECEARTEANSKLQEELANLEKKLGNARSLFGTEQAKYKKERSEFEALVTAQKEEISSLMDQLKAAQSELEQQGRQLKSTRADYEDQLALIRSNLSAREAKISELVAEKDETTMALSDCREELSVAKLDIQRLDESRTRSREELTHLTSLMDSQRADHIAQLNDMIQRHNEETTKFMKEKEVLDATIRKGEELRAKMQRQISETEKLLEEERETNESLLVEHDALTASLHRAEDMVADLKCELAIIKEEQANESIDSIDSQTLALSKSELRTKCKYLAEEIQDAELRAAAGKSTVSQKQAHIRRLEEDMAEMSAELGRMIETWEQMEAALLKARMDKANSEADAETLRTSIDVHHAKTKALKEELDQQYNENSELLDQVRDLQIQHKKSREREESLEKDLAESRQALKLSDADNIEAKEDLMRLTQDLADAQAKKAEAEDRLSSLEFEATKLEDDLATAEKDKEVLQSAATYASERHEEQLRDMRSESASLKSTIAELESDIDAKKSSILAMKETESSLVEKLDKERKYGMKIERQREEAVSKLAEASRVLAAQKGIIAVQEARAAEAEENSRKLSDEVESLKDTISKLESTTQENGMLRSAQLEDLEKKRSNLEKARLNAKAEADALRDEVRQANRRASELERHNKSLQTQIEEIKHKAESTKAQLREARGAWSESDNLSRSLENDLQTSRAEIDHLRAKLQLCGATIARLKSDRVLLQQQQEAVMQSEIKKSTNGDANNDSAREISRLRSELHTRASQLSSAASTLRSYKKMCQDMKTSEKELVVFIGDIISRADDTFNALSKTSSELKALSGQPGASIVEQDLRSLDLAISTSDTPQKVIDDANCCLNNFVALIQQASVELEGKKRKLAAWKSRNKLHAASTPQNKTTAPTGEALLTPNESSVQRTFRKLKEGIDSKNETTDGASVGSSKQIESVIVSLEGQIDALCSELRAANTALQSKDKLFADLEHQRKVMEKRLECAVFQQQSTKSSTLSRIEEVSEEEREKMQKAAVRAMAKVFESRNKAEAASALRKWSSSVAALHVAEQKDHAAIALSHQLEMTRGKLVQLKSHFRRSKAGTPSSIRSTPSSQNY